MSFTFCLRPALVGMTAALVLTGSPSRAQSAPQAETTAQVQQLQSDLKDARADLLRAQKLLTELTARLDVIQDQTPSSSSTEAQARDLEKAKQFKSPFLSPVDMAKITQGTPQSTMLSDSLEDNDYALAQRVEEQQQIKVESASKYRVKLSGLILMSAFSNRGAVDIPDLANLALNSPDTRGSVGASLRQTMIGLQVFGPELAGAATSAAVSVDFFGGFPPVSFGSTSGLIRLRTAGARLDWRNTFFAAFTHFVRNRRSASALLFRQFMGLDTAGNSGAQNSHLG
jgi:hypothetical protein